jgi:hypothetical protein
VVVGVVSSVEDVDSPVELVPSLAPVFAVEPPHPAMIVIAAISFRQEVMPARYRHNGAIVEAVRLGR